MRPALAILPIPAPTLKKIREAEVVIMEEAVQQMMVASEPTQDQETIKETEEKKESPKQIETEPNKPQHEISTKSLKKEPAEIVKEPVVVSVAKTVEEPMKLDTEEEKLLLRPLKIHEREVAAFLAEYQTGVSAKLIQSYVPCAELLEKSQTGYEPCWLCLRSDSNSADHKKIKGLAVFHIDPTSKLRVRVNILHATAEESTGNVKDFLQQVVDYIWANVNCEEIRVGLAHIEQAGEKYIPYDPLKNAYQDLQFRWKTLTNDEQGKRILVLGLSRPATKPFLNPR